MARPLLSHCLYGSRLNPAVLMLHGFLGCGKDWEATAKALSDAFSVVTVDLPGHGRSVEGLDDAMYAMPGCAGAVLEVLDRCGVDRCHLVGYSMGGRLALYLASRHPERFVRAIIESASPGLKTDEERRARRRSDQALVERLLSRGLGDLLSEWYSQPLFEPLTRCDGFKDMLQQRRTNDPQGLARSLRWMGTGAQPSLWEDLARLQIPVLFLAGGLDAKFRNLAEAMAARCPTSRMHIVEGVGHTIHVESPAHYLGIVRQFLEERK